MSDTRTSEFQRRRKANFRKGMEIGIKEGRRREREALTVQLAPIGYITSDAASLLKLGHPCQAVHPCPEHEFTVPVYLGPQSMDARMPAMASMEYNGDCFIDTPAPIKTPPPNDWNVFERPSRNTAAMIIGMDFGSPEGDTTVLFKVGADGRMEVISAEDVAPIITKDTAHD